MSSDPAVELLETDMTPAERKVERRLVEETVRAFRKSSPLVIESPLGKEALLAEQLASFLLARLAERLEEIRDLRTQYAEYVRRYTRATSPEDARRHILEFARRLGASRRQLRGDRKAFRRWFGHEAVSERCSCRRGLLERWMVFELKRVGPLAAQALSSARDPSESALEWSRLQLEARLRPILAYDGDPRVPTAALAALSRALRGLPPEMRERSVEQSTLQFVYRSAMHPRADVWLQCQALALLEILSPHSLEKVLRHRLANPAAGDDLFVRRRAVEALGRNLAALPGLANLLPAVAKDPSPFVRQGLSRALGNAPAELAIPWLRWLAREDPAPQVRGYALREALRSLEKDAFAQAAFETIAEGLDREEDPLALRVAIEVAAAAALRRLERGDPDARSWAQGIAERLDRLHVCAKDIPTRRYAAQARERIWCATDARAQALRDRLEPIVGLLARGRGRWMTEDLIPFRDPDLVGRVLSVLSQRDFPYYVERRDGRVRIVRGDEFVFRLWRFLYEVRHPSPDKRQAFRHTVGRRCPGELRAPSAILCELSETNVPGEPLFLAEEGGWRPYLPLLDDFVSTLGLFRAPRPVRIYSSEGVTEIRPPASLRSRLAARTRLARDFARIAKLRNWRSESQVHPAAYLRALQGLGFVVRHAPHGGEDGRATTLDPEVAKFFPAALPFLDGELLRQIREYFFSVYGNSLLDLAFFASVATALFFGRHVHATQRIRRARRRIPLVIGGWGTRGKSGTERLKAALVSALGYGVVSKTTGCEAMFLFAHPFQKTREMFLFRSYDKATIWEQSNVLRLAARLGAEVFLWECMALTPSYVEVLQRHWVRDDLSTITNTYPDHEDIQGPAGINIPDVIATFIPERARLVTTEEIMLPILAEESRKLGTALRRVTWMDSSLLAPDVLARFPYDEHPSNVALVLGLAEELGVPEDFALKEMADRVVPDLGVLKTYPAARVDGRRLSFVNGMSANERHGTISNWIRCKFHLQDPYVEPGVWISTVVNNRADRVARSRVFARVLVEDLSADRHFLIGGNLTGLQGYIRQSWEAWVPKVSLWPKDSERDPLAIFLEMARRFRQPTERAHVAAWLRAMVEGERREEQGGEALEACLEDPKKLEEHLLKRVPETIARQILEHHARHLQALREYEAMAERIRKARDEERPQVDREFRQLLWTWFERKLVVVEDYYISGEQLVKLIADKTPPGYLNRVMGIQNIKGTGLDFVYRWQAWDVCWRACEALESNDSQLVERGLKTLSSFHEFGVLSKERVARTLEAVKGLRAVQNESCQAELAVIRTNYEVAMKKLEEKLRATKRKVSRFEKLLGTIEAFADAGDAVRRRRVADRIYEDLVWKRISTDRAVYELQSLNKRQKGGWLAEKVYGLKRSFVRNLREIVRRGTK